MLYNKGFIYMTYVCPFTISLLQFATKQPIIKQTYNFRLPLPSLCNHFTDDWRGFCNPHILTTIIIMICIQPRAQHIPWLLLFMLSTLRRCFYYWQVLTYIVHNIDDKYNGDWSVHIDSGGYAFLFRYNMWVEENLFSFLVNAG